MACTNPTVKIEGRCEFCDARCGYYINNELLTNKIYEVINWLYDFDEYSIHQTKVEELNKLIKKLMEKINAE